MNTLEYRAAGRHQDLLPDKKGKRKETPSADEIEVDPEEDPADLSANLLKNTTDGYFWTHPWFGWCFTYTFVLSFFFIYRFKDLDAVILMYGSAADITFVLKVKVLLLGLLEDFVCATYFTFTLWALDLVKRAAKRHFKYQGGRGHADFQKHKRFARLASNFVTFVVSWNLFIIMALPVVCDMLFVHLRELRFTIDILIYAYAERNYINEAPISSKEFYTTYLYLFNMVVAATIIATVRTKVRWADLSRWSPLHSAVEFVMSCTNRFVLKSTKHEGQSYAKLSIADTPGQSVLPTALDTSADSSSVCRKRVSQATVLFAVLIAFPLLVVKISSSSSTLVAFSAVSMTLNQIFVQSLLPRPQQNARSEFWAETFIHSPTEEYELFGNQSLYRRTTGFRGDLAFDIEIDKDDPPNVIFISLESARHHNSRYLVGEHDPSNLFNGSNITVSPNFDKWAKRGVSFSNMWSSCPSSRSLESVLYAQVPYDNTAKTAIAGGRVDTQLYGVPQLFQAKGYETHFMSGSKLTYDDWDMFLSSHGFDTVLGYPEMKMIAERDLGIKPEEWDEPEMRKLAWGIHDDINFQILGNLLVKKTREQKKRMANGMAKNPLFLMQYTISSHEPFLMRPTWYDRMEKPDFSALYEGYENSERVKDYLEMQYFVDMELGKFMDRMESEGVLKNTIVVIFGDHGRGVEVQNSDFRDVSVTRVPATIVAEGRLGNSVGLIIDDATEHYDLLNTMADITGLPEGGYVQDGVGRSLKRKIPPGEHVIFSNNPSRKMSVVRGHQRLQYNRDFDAVLLHNVDTDHDMQVNLFSNLTAEEQKDWLTWRDLGRDISLYYLERWDKNCLLAVDCT